MHLFPTVSVFIWVWMWSCFALIPGTAYCIHRTLHMLQLSIAAFVSIIVLSLLG